MPKIIELTVEIDIQRVSCPGVWLCQDGRVSLTVFALGTSYQTCLLPPVFPLLFKDIFYFRKRFQETCSLNNITCLLKEETIFCELVQLSENCSMEECTTLAQYLGALNDVLFPPNMCSSDGVDLLMRRSKDFPGILSPKIEIATKVRIDEVLNHSYCVNRTTPCYCSQYDEIRQKQVCHTPEYHRNKCYSATKHCRSRSRSGSSRSCMSLKEPEIHLSCKCPNPFPCPRSRRSPGRRPRSVSNTSPSSCHVYNANTGDVADAALNKNSFKKRYLEPDNDNNPPSSRSARLSSLRPRSPNPSHERSSRSPSHPRQYQVYHVDMGGVANVSWNKGVVREDSAKVNDEMRPNATEKMPSPNEERMQKTLLESRYIENEINDRFTSMDKSKKKIYKPKIRPCICEICKRYHELFHGEQTIS